MAKTRHIGVLNEGALHAALKAQYLGAEGQAEVSLGDFVADVLCDGVVYEIQTSSFSGLALGTGPPDPAFRVKSVGISLIFLPILRATLGSDSAALRCAWAPLTFQFLCFPKEFQ